MLSDNRTPETLIHNLLHNWLDEDALFALPHILNCSFAIYHINDSAKNDDGTSFSQLTTIEKEQYLQRNDPPHTIQLLLENSTHFSPLLALTNPRPPRNPLSKRKSKTSPESPSPPRCLKPCKPSAATLSCAAQYSAAETAKSSKKPRATTPELSSTMSRNQRDAALPLPSMPPQSSGPAPAPTNPKSPVPPKHVAKKKVLPNRSCQKPNPIPLMQVTPLDLSDLQEPTSSSSPKSIHLQDQPPLKKQKLISTFFLPTSQAQNSHEEPQPIVPRKQKRPHHEATDSPQKTKAKKQNERSIP
jgi:hypothetical protein